MKRRQRQLIVFLSIVLIAISCSSTPATSNRDFFTGFGGREMRLGIIVPQSQGLNENQSYIPAMVQGHLVSNVSRFSAIRVLDRVSLDRVLLETLDPIYEDNFDIVRLGHVAQVGYMMTGNIIRTSTGYTLQINVTDTTPEARTIASFSGTSTVAEFNDFSAINRATLVLLEQMGVELTDIGRAELSRASSRQEIGAQTSLAQGVVAQQRGTIIEAITHFHNAVSFDPNISEANRRLSTLSSNVSTGNIGENIRNEIQMRNEWVKILNEAEDFFSRHLPFELVYSTSLNLERIDFAREMAILTSSIMLRPANSFQVFNDIKTGLSQTGRMKEWGVALWPACSDIFSQDRTFNYFPQGGGTTRRIADMNVNVDIVLLDENETIISRSNVVLRSNIQFGLPPRRWRFRQEVNRSRTPGTHAFLFEQNLDRSLPDYFYRGIGHGLVVDTRKLEATEDSSLIQFFVNADAITDALTIKIVSVNDVNIVENPDFIRVTTQSTPIRNARTR